MSSNVKKKRFYRYVSQKIKKKKEYSPHSPIDEAQDLVAMDTRKAEVL